MNCKIPSTIGTAFYTCLPINNYVVCWNTFVIYNSKDFVNLSLSLCIILSGIIFNERLCWGQDSNLHTDLP